MINSAFGYVHKKEDLVFLKGLENGLRQILLDGFRLHIVTNQAGIAKGYYTESEFHEFMIVMLQELKLRGIDISGYEYCPHRPNGLIKRYTRICACRKPQPGMIFKVLSREGVDAENCIIIGDKITDILAGKNAGIKRRILINSGCRAINKDFCEQVSNWAQVSLKA